MLAGFINDQLNGSLSELTESFIDVRLKLRPSSAEIKATSFQCFEYLKSLSPRDSFELFIDLDGEIESISDCHLASKNSLETFFSNHLTIDESEIELVIKKSVVDSTLSVYFFDNFFSYLSNEPLVNVFRSFSKNIFEQLIFEVFSNINEFGSNTIRFFESGSDQSILVANDNKQRLDILQSLKENGIIWNEDLKLIPSDFELIKETSDVEVTAFFKKASAILSLAFLSNNAELTVTNEFTYRINGYKSISSTLNPLSTIQEKSKILLRIYNWVYAGGNNADKLGLARNVFSIHLDIKGNIEIEEEVWSAIQSNYQIYLKANIQSYLEVKNKIGELLVDSIAKTDLIVEGLLDTLKQNIAVLITFVLTVVIINGVKDTNAQTVFSTPYLYIVSILLVVSNYWMKWISKDVISRLNNSTNSISEILVNNYNKILLQDEIEELIEHVKVKQRDFILEKTKTYNTILKAFVIFIFIAFLLGNLGFDDKNVLWHINEWSGNIGSYFNQLKINLSEHFRSS